jgi:hypothetical protein|tara:strand:+ start:376 stop:708 length:333 start_codon:yes stop_codon:yes gene_type:complete
MKIDDSIMKSRKKLAKYLFHEGLPFGINRAFEIMAKPKSIKKGTNPESVEFDFTYGVGKSMSGNLRIEKDGSKYNIFGKRSDGKKVEAKGLSGNLSSMLEQFIILRMHTR